MKIRHAYEGTLNGIKGVWGDTHPEDVVVEKVIMFLTADDSDHELQNKETKEKRSSVIIKDETEQDNWEEVERDERTFEPDAFDTKEQKVYN